MSALDIALLGDLSGLPQYPDGDAFFAQVISLVHFNEAQDTAIPVDVINPSNAWVNSANTGSFCVSLAKTASARFGPAGWRHQMNPGIAGGLRRQFSSLAAVPFTSEGHIRFTALGAFGSVFHRFGQLVNITTGEACGFSVNSSTGKLMAMLDQTGATDTTGNIVTNQWYHVALCRTAGGIKFFLNGILVYTSGAWTMTGGNNWDWRPDQNGSNGGYYNGDLDDWRLTWGVARYGSNFTPPSAPFPDSASAGTPPDGSGMSTAFTALAPRVYNLGSSTHTLLYREAVTFGRDGIAAVSGIFGSPPAQENWATPTTPAGAAGFEYRVLAGAIGATVPATGWVPFSAAFTLTAPISYGGYQAGTLAQFEIRKISQPSLIASYQVTYTAFGAAIFIPPQAPALPPPPPDPAPAPPAPAPAPVPAPAPPAPAPAPNPVGPPRPLAFTELRPRDIELNLVTVDNTLYAEFVTFTLDGLVTEGRAGSSEVSYSPWGLPTTPQGGINFECLVYEGSFIEGVPDPVTWFTLTGPLTIFHPGPANGTGYITLVRFSLRSILNPSLRAEYTVRAYVFSVSDGGGG